jgi:hypothetical protein
MCVHCLEHHHIFLPLIKEAPYYGAMKERYKSIFLYYEQLEEIVEDEETLTNTNTNIC